MSSLVAIADKDVREEVLDPARSFIVQAPAGSGKTEVLIRRYLRLLLVVNQPEEIVAITFTRKAATEMRERILNSLESAVLDPNGQSHQDLRARERWEIARKVLNRSDQLGWRLTTNPARTRIQTIDSFCGSLVKQMPVLSRLGGLPEILEDAGPLYREAADEVLKILNEDIDTEQRVSDDKHLSESLAILLRHLDNDLPRIRDLISTMLEKRDQWQDYAFDMQSAKDNPNIDFRAILESHIERHIESVIERARANIPKDSRAEFSMIMNYALANLGVIMPNQFIDDILEENSGGIEIWQQITKVCLTNDGTWRKRITVKEGFPSGSENAHFKLRFESLLGTFDKVEQLEEYFRQVQRLPEPSYTTEEWSVLEVIPELLRRAYAELRLLFKERNQVDFVEMSVAANHALGEEDDPTDLTLYLDHRIQHILIDEYQDSSKGQQRLLEKLTAGWTDADGHSLFLVGDPMQSIYRFRDAEVGLFLKTWNDQQLGQISVHPRQITMNFRSDEALVSWVNDTLPEVFPKLTNRLMGAVTYTPAVAFQSYEEECGTKLYALNGSMEEAQQVVDLIRKTQEVYPSDTIAILVRSRNHLKRIVPALIQSKISFRAVDTERLGNNPVIQDLIALTRALHHEADRVSWFAVLRAPWCGLTLKDLFQLAGENREQTIWQCIRNDSIIETLSQDGQGRLLRMRSALEKAFDLEGRVSLRRWIEGAWINLGGPASLKHEDDLINAETFFCELNAMDEGGYICDRKAFLERINALFARADTQSDGTLQIMTIHKAKGLEFDHVILPGLGNGGGRSSEQLFLWSEIPDGLLVAPIKSPTQEISSNIYKFIQDYEKKRREYEESRLLYVALTRARKNLHLMMTVRTSEPPQGSMLAKLWPALFQEYHRLSENIKTVESVHARQQSENDSARNIRRLNTSWCLPDPPTHVEWTPSFSFDQRDDNEDFKSIKFKWAGQTIKQVGIIVHRCLQQITTEGAEHWNADRITHWQDYFRDSLKSVGVANEDLKEAISLVRSALTQTLQDPCGQWIISSKHKDAKCEFALSGVYRGNLVNIVIDRTFVDEKGVRWIVDYKTSRRESGGIEEFLNDQVDRYKSQLEKYRDIMSSFDDRPIRVGLYFPLLMGWRELPIRD